MRGISCHIVCVTCHHALRCTEKQINRRSSHANGLFIGCMAFPIEWHVVSMHLECTKHTHSHGIFHIALQYKLSFSKEPDAFVQIAVEKTIKKYHQMKSILMQMEFSFFLLLSEYVVWGIRFWLGNYIDTIAYLHQYQYPMPDMEKKTSSPDEIKIQGKGASRLTSKFTWRICIFTVVYKLHCAWYV